MKKVHSYGKILKEVSFYLNSLNANVIQTPLRQNHLPRPLDTDDI